MFAASSVIVAAPSPPAATVAAPPTAAAIAANKEKSIRALKKKIRLAEDLRDNSAGGELNSDQLAKIASLNTLMSELALLEKS